jgi:hypothetical protein
VAARLAGAQHGCGSGANCEHQAGAECGAPIVRWACCPDPRGGRVTGECHFGDEHIGDRPDPADVSEPYDGRLALPLVRRGPRRY